MPRKDFKEADMYAPLKKHFERLGYTARAEVKGIDVVLTKGDEVVIIEMKKAFNMKVVFQALDGQKVAGGAYIALPGRAFVKNRKHILHILQRLGIGLVTVDIDKRGQPVQVHLVPNMASGRNSKASRALLDEFNGRTFDDNIGGQTGEKIMTAHKERCIQIAVALKQLGTSSPANLVKNHACHKTTGQILRINFYGWYEKVDKGLYALSWQGHEALESPMFAKLVAHYEKGEDHNE